MRPRSNRLCAGGDFFCCSSIQKISKYKRSKRLKWLRAVIYNSPPTTSFRHDATRYECLPLPHSPMPRPPIKRIARPPAPQFSSSFDSRATHARVLLPEALASVPFGVVLVRVQVRLLYLEMRSILKPPRRDTRALSPAGMFGGKAPLRLAAQKSRPHAPSVPMLY